MTEYQRIAISKKAYLIIKQLAADSNRTIDGMVTELAERELERRTPYSLTPSPILPTKVQTGPTAR